MLGGWRDSEIEELARFAVDEHNKKEVLKDEDKRVKYDREEDLDEMKMRGGGGNPFGEQRFTFHFESGFHGGGFPGGFGF